MTTSTALIADHHAPEEHGRVLGLQGAAMGFGGVVALLLGGLLAALDWRGPFAIYLLAIPMLALVLRFVPDAPVQPTDPTDTTTAASPWQPRLLGLYALIFIGVVVFYTVPTQAPFWLAEVGGAGPAVAGALIAAVNLVMTLVGLNFRRLRARWSFPMLAIAMFAAFAVGLVVLGTMRRVVDGRAGHGRGRTRRGSAKPDRQRMAGFHRFPRGTDQVTRVADVRVVPRPVLVAADRAAGDRRSRDGDDVHSGRSFGRGRRHYRGGDPSALGLET